MAHSHLGRSGKRIGVLFLVVVKTRTLHCGSQKKERNGECIKAIRDCFPVRQHRNEKWFKSALTFIMGDVRDMGGIYTSERALSVIHLGGVSFK